MEGDSDAVVLDRASRAISEARKAWESVLADGPYYHSPSSRGGGSGGSSGKGTAVEEDWKKDVKDTMRACIGASIAIETVRKALGNAQKSGTDGGNGGGGGARLEGSLTVNIPEVGSKARWHDWWVVPQVVESESRGRGSG